MMLYEGTYSVYIHINLINGKKYVGITSINPEARWNKGKNYRHCIHFWNAIQKYGWDNFEHFIFSSGLNEDEARNIEKILIEKLNTQNRQYGYNVLEGGQASHHPDSVKRKISESQKRIANTPEHKERFMRMLNKLNSSGLNKGKSKPVKCIETNQVYANAVIAGECMNIKGGGHTITNMLNGWQNSAGGYHFTYV